MAQYYLETHRQQQHQEKFVALISQAVDALVPLLNKDVSWFLFGACCSVYSWGCTWKGFYLCTLKLKLYPPFVFFCTIKRLWCFPFSDPLWLPEFVELKDLPLNLGLHLISVYCSPSASCFTYFSLSVYLLSRSLSGFPFPRHTCWTR